MIEYSNGVIVEYFYSGYNVTLTCLKHFHVNIQYVWDTDGAHFKLNICQS